MGLIMSKIFKYDLKVSKNTEEQKIETPKEVTKIMDPRSPTGQILRTPIIVEKAGPAKNHIRENKSEPLRNKLLKSLKLDPRSPTVGIYRTPIFVEDVDTNKVKTGYDSPISIYSSNLSDSVVQDVMTPIEPSVNVSGFEEAKDIELDEINIILEAERKTKVEKHLKILDEPSTFESRKLLDEIISSSEEENFIKKAKMPVKKDKKVDKTSENKVVNDIKGNKLKSRPPLSNITSSTNSPNQIIAPVKLYGKNKVVAESGSENTVSPKHIGQWDQNNTVII